MALFGDSKIVQNGYVKILDQVSILCEGPCF